jgi:Tol biopolymer transport system component
MFRFRAAVLLLLSVVLLGSGPAWAAFPGKNGKVAFSGFADGTYRVFTVNPDGTARTAITDTSLIARGGVSWSPDGSTIAFGAQPRSGGAFNFDIYTVKADGSGLTRLTNAPSDDQHPTWSPDGTRIAFESARGDVGDSDIYLMNADGSNQSRLTFRNTGPDDSRSASNPAWSPDGTRIAFVADLRAGFGPVVDIHTVNADGTDDTNLTADFDSAAREPDWSPDGARLVFFSDVPNAIWAMNAEGTGKAKLKDGGSSPAWSPDGTRIAYQALDPNGFSVRLETMSAEGSDAMALTDGPQDFDAEWQPIPGPRRSDYKNVAQFCKAEQAFWGDQFAGRYGGGANAYGKCVSQNH